MSLRYMTAGESHGPSLVAIVDGLPAGLEISRETFARHQARRRGGAGAGLRMGMESDTPECVGGVMEGRTTGAPLALRIVNSDHAQWRGVEVPPITVPRPGHSDLVGALKYGFDDARPALERASARETAMRVAVGSVCRQLLGEMGIRVGGYVSAIGPVEAALDALSFEERIEKAGASNVNCPDPEASALMEAAIREAADHEDTLGGIVEIVALGVPPGLGSYAQWDRRIDAKLGEAIMSVPAMKGMEIGQAFANAKRPGTQAQDAIRLEGGRIVRPTSRLGGIEAGVTNGEPLWIRVAMRPIATTKKPQASVDLSTGKEAASGYERSDVCPTPRAVVVLESMVAWVLAVALMDKIGGDSIAEMRPRFEALRRANLGEVKFANRTHVYWPADPA